MNVDIISSVFENPLILKIILSHVSNVADLKSVRLVNRLWRKESLEKWRSTATIQLLWKGRRWLPCSCLKRGADQNGTSPQGRGLGQDEFLRNREISIEQGVDCPHQLAKRPFSRYRLINCSILDMEVDSWKLKNLGNFLDVVGPHLKYLHLDHSALQPDNHEDILRWLLCEKMTSLEELSLCLIPTDPVDNRDRTEGLKWSTPLPVSKIRTLSIQLCESWSHVDKLSNMVEYCTRNREKSLSGTVPAGISFPQLTKLYLYSERVLSLKALRKLTGLKVLWIDSYKCTNDWNQRIVREAEEMKDEGMLWGELEHLHMDYYRFNPNTLRTLWKWMPKLRKLQLVFSPSTRGVAQQLWPNLEELTNLNSLMTTK